MLRDYSENTDPRKLADNAQAQVPNLRCTTRPAMTRKQLTVERATVADCVSSNTGTAQTKPMPKRRERSALSACIAKRDTTRATPRKREGSVAGKAS